MIEAQDLTVGYGSNVVLAGVSLSFSAGEITALIGANGCGKSTLLRAIAGISRPLAGAVYLHGQPISALGRRQIARSLAFQSQSPEAPEGISVRQLVEHGAFARKPLFSRPDRRDVNAALARVDLDSFAERPFSALSGGERQRAWIALVLLQAPEMILLDEPTSFLDLGYQIETLRLLDAIRRERGTGIVMVLHDINQAARFADRIIALHAGRVHCQGPPAKVIDAALLQTLFRAKVRVDQDHAARPFVTPLW